MATNAYGKDFWVGQILGSKDKREHGRHVQIADIQSGKALCNTVIRQTSIVLPRKNRISLKTLAERWEICTEKRACSACAVVL
jgi:hypothetical protein